MKTTKQEMKKIKSLLNELNANNALRKNVFDILKSPPGAYDIFPNTIINGLSLGLELLRGAVNVAFISPMQSGKSGSMFFLNWVLPEIGYLGEDENILFLTSMRDKDLYDQNVKNMTKNYYDHEAGVAKRSRIYVYKIDEIFKEPNPFEIVQRLNIKLFIRDEDAYGAGEESTFDRGFFQTLRMELPEMPLIGVSATPYDLLDAKMNGYTVSVVKGEVPSNYIGISKMLKLGLIEDYDDSFEPFEEISENGGTSWKVTYELDCYMQHLFSYEDGVGIIRIPKTLNAILLREIAKNAYSGMVTPIVIGSDSMCDYSIAEGIAQLDILVNVEHKRVLLIVVQALSAGKDFGLLKNKIRFGIETRRTQLANGAQGIPGRICGYHANISFKLMASKELLENYAQFEKNWRVYEDEAWRNKLANSGVVNLCTQVSINESVKAKLIRPIVEMELIPYDVLTTPRGRSLVNWLTDSEYAQLLLAFTKRIWFHGDKYKLVTERSIGTARLASAYDIDDTRVYDNWNRFSIGDDFDVAMFRKSSFTYGVYISNIPLGKVGYNGNTNKANFLGIKIFKAGKEVPQGSVTVTNSESMYNRISA